MGKTDREREGRGENAWERQIEREGRGENAWERQNEEGEIIHGNDR